MPDKQTISADSNMPRNQAFVLYWLLLMAGILVAAVVLWHQGLFHQLFASDVSRLSSVILAAFLVSSVHAGFYLIRFTRDAETLRKQWAGNVSILSDGPPGAVDADGIPRRIKDPLSAIEGRHRSRIPPDGLQYSEPFRMLENQIKAPVRFGWLLSDLLIKLGLLGTVVGFILMLGAISGGAAVDISNIDTLLAEMGSGMRVALFTTLTGLSTGTLLGFQYFIVERSADTLLAVVIRLIERRGETGGGPSGSD